MQELTALVVATHSWGGDGVSRVDRYSYDKVAEHA